MRTPVILFERPTLLQYNLILTNDICHEGLRDWGLGLQPVFLWRGVGGVDTVNS